MTQMLLEKDHDVGYPAGNGQAEGQLNRLKTLKRSVYGRDSYELGCCHSSQNAHAK
jgi:hypothetical protein